MPCSAGGGVKLVASLLLVVVALAVAAQLERRSDDGPPVLVRGTIGSAKAGLLDNPEVREILADRYGLRVEFTTAGSLEIMENTPADRRFPLAGRPDRR